MKLIVAYCCFGCSFFAVVARYDVGEYSTTYNYFRLYLKRFDVSCCRVVGVATLGALLHQTGGKSYDVDEPVR